MRSLCNQTRVVLAYDLDTVLQVDAPLDTVNVERVADFLARQKDAQYLLVTHRPQVGCWSALQLCCFLMNDSHCC
jgi:hypothetical protein